MPPPVPCVTLVTPSTYPSVPDDSVAPVPGVVDETVAEAEADVRPPLPVAQANQPFLAFVLTVTVRPVVTPIEEGDRLAVNESVLPLNARLKLGGTVALTTIWSLLIVRIAMVVLSAPTVTTGWYSPAVGSVRAVAVVKSTQYAVVADRAVIPVIDAVPPEPDAASDPGRAVAPVCAAQVAELTA